MRAALPVWENNIKMQVPAVASGQSCTHAAARWRAQQDTKVRTPVFDGTSPVMREAPVTWRTLEQMFVEAGRVLLTRSCGGPRGCVVPDPRFWQETNRVLRRSRPRPKTQFSGQSPAGFFRQHFHLDPASLGRPDRTENLLDSNLGI